MNRTYSKTQLSILRLAYPPISNQEAVWLEDVPAAVEQMRHSDLYMIGGRAELKITGLTVDTESHIASFGLGFTGEEPDPVKIHLTRLPCVQGREDYCLVGGEKFFQIRDSQDQTTYNALDTFTTERLLVERAHRNPAIEGLNRFRDFANYDLLYAGIAKVGDSFSRLIEHGHKARMDILSNEPQRYPGARVTDEIFLFLFHLSPLGFTTYEPSHEFTDDEFLQPIDTKRAVADAEKAYVNLLKPDYNTVLFKEYPKGVDGLYDSDLERYGHMIGETLTFNTAHGRIKGAAPGEYGQISNDADCILVEGDKVTVLVSGVDFPSDSGGTAAG